MADIDELEIDRAAPPPEGPGAEDPSRRPKWIAPLAIALLGVGVWLGFVIYQRWVPAAPPPEEEAISTPAPVEPAPAAPRLEGEAIDLPPLGDTDPLVRMLVGRLSAQPKVLAWLATTGLIEGFTVVTLNIAEGHPPLTRLQSLAPRGQFRVRTSRGRTIIDPQSYRRYDDYAAAVGSLDATGTARLYLTLKPRIVDAYRQLGHQDGDFDPVLERAISVLLAVPVIEDDILVREKVVTYQFADPATEALSPAARHLLRVGPANVRIVQAKLREIAALLGLRP